MDLSIFFAGTGRLGPQPSAAGLPAILVRRGGDRILFDCGEGTQRQLVSSVGLADLTEIFLTHFHTDHWLGPAGDAQHVQPARPRSAADDPRPAAASTNLMALRAADERPARLRAARCVELEQRRRGGARRLPDRASRRSRTAGPSLRLRPLRGRAARDVFDPEAAAAARPDPRARSSGACSAARRSAGSRPADVMGPTPARAASWCSPATPRPSRVAPAWRPTAPMCWSTRRRSPTRSATGPPENGHSTAPPGGDGLASDAEVELLALNHISTRHPLAA